MKYAVISTIELDADSPEKAACQALSIGRDPGSLAAHFIIQDQTGNDREMSADARES